MKKQVFSQLEVNQNDWWINGRADIIISLLSKYISKDSKILDVGAGIGLITEKIIAAGYKKIVATDTSNTSLGILRKKNIKCQKMTLPNAKTKDKFDAILLLDVIEHVKDDEDSLSNLRKLLTNRGLCIITVPAFPFLWSKKDDEYGHLRRYTRGELKDKILTAGFRIKYLSYYNFFLFLPAIIFSAINRKKMRAKRYDSKQDKLFYPIFRSESAVIRSGLRFPFGVSLIAVIEK